MKIGLDIMGGDFSPKSGVLGAIQAQQILKDAQLVLFGDQEIIETLLKREGEDITNYQIVHTSQTIEMHEHPAKAFRSKQDSSIAKGFEFLAKKEIDSFASAGNSGAMLVGSMYAIKPILGVIRPCITSILPKENGKDGVILDVGVNADCKPDVLYQFGVLGSLFAEFVYKIPAPRVGLLNLGREKEKGNLLSQAANQLMEGSKDFNFTGNIEGGDLFLDDCDVVVCDGFTGNVVLKQAEYFHNMTKKRGIEDEYFARFNYELYGGTPVLGVNGNVLIGHGKSSPKAIKNMLLLSRDLVLADLPSKIKQRLNE